MKHCKQTILIASSLILLASCGGSEDNTTNVNDINIFVNDSTNATQTLETKVNKTYNLKAEVLPKEAPQEVSRSIDNSNVATITNEGVLTTSAVGTATIKATSVADSRISKNLYLEVKGESISVFGSGKSKDDPLLLNTSETDEPLEIYFIEMRQMYADSIYIKKGSFDMLIDAGEDYDGKYISTFLDEKMEDDTLDVLMASHGDADHINGMSSALKNIKNVSMIIDYGGQQETNGYVSKKNEFIKNKEHPAKYHTAIDCVEWANGATDKWYLTPDLTLEILDTGNYCRNEDRNASNPYSVACMFEYKDFSFFTAGDLTASSERELLKRDKDLHEVTLYKASHHGSSGSNTRELLDTLNPKAVAISAARSTTNFGIAPSDKPTKQDTNLDLTGGHPHKETLDRIYKTPNIMKTLDVHWNAVNGTMCYQTTGQNDFKFTGSPTMKGYYDLSSTGGKGVWNEQKGDFENRVTGEEQKKLHETVAFHARGWDDLVSGLL